MSEPLKYSLWIVPGGDAGKQVQTLINDLAAKHNAPAFVPHLTAVANILPGDTPMDEVHSQVAALAAQVQPFTVTLTGYGYKDEEFRCLYLLAEAPEFAALYGAATELFPQVATEHFAGMPHISVLYGNFDEATKNGIIETHPITPITFTVTSLELWHTNNPVESWELTRSFPIGQ